MFKQMNSVLFSRPKARTLGRLGPWSSGHDDTFRSHTLTRVVLLFAEQYSLISTIITSIACKVFHIITNLERLSCSSGLFLSLRSLGASLNLGKVEPKEFKRKTLLVAYNIYL